MGGTPQAENLTPIFARMNAVIAYLSNFGVKRTVRINPLASFNDRFYRGSIMFQCIKELPLPRKVVFAAGGRYDRLCQEFNTQSSSKRRQIHAVGFTIGSDMLYKRLTEYMNKPTRSFSSSRSSDSDTSSQWKRRRVSQSPLRTSYEGMPKPHIY